jgi:hypothetical protein
MLPRRFLPVCAILHRPAQADAARWIDTNSSACRANTMLLTLAVLVLVGGVVIIHKTHLARSMHNPELGSMSASWIAEYRASHPS